METDGGLGPVFFSDLKEKVVLVTGATRGIGRETALFLASQGCRVVFNYRKGREEMAQSLKGELEKRGAVKADGLLFDVRNRQQTAHALGEFVKKEAPVAGLVNNAGISQDELLLRMKEENLTKILETNLMGSIWTAKALGFGFLRLGRASIVNVSSVVGSRGNAGQTAYAASKAGLLGFTKSLAKEMAGKNVRCNAICPGFIETDMVQGLDGPLKESYLSSIPLKRFGTVSEVAVLIGFLISDASSYITGEVIRIDGGMFI